MAEENSSEICPEPISETKEDDVSSCCVAICPNQVPEPEAAEINFSKLIEPIYNTLPESIKKQYQTRLTNNKITSTFSAGSIQTEDEDNAEKAHAIILKVQASYIKKRELCRLKQKEQRDALKTLTKLPTVEPQVEIPIEQIPSVQIPPDLMDDKTRFSFEKLRFPEVNTREPVKPMPVRERVRPDKLSIEPRQKKAVCLICFVSY